MIFLPLDEADAKHWLKLFMQEYQKGEFDYSKWIQIKRHAYADYPCRELTERIILKSMNHIINIVTNYTQEPNSYIIYSQDKDAIPPTQQEDLEIIINFNKAGKGTIVSAWRENSPKNCCCTKLNLRRNRLPCKYLLNSRRL
ncbi:hypothetical protein [Spirobacillus cienkowskii]|uniref:hypothetical protein n=1 Tax=Spirobacillus cienkowskii TaxID=495820 RepID=UPI0030D43BBB